MPFSGMAGYNDLLVAVILWSDRFRIIRVAGRLFMFLARTGAVWNVPFLT